MLNGKKVIYNGRVIPIKTCSGKRKKRKKNAKETILKQIKVSFFGFHIKTGIDGDDNLHLGRHRMKVIETNERTKKKILHFEFCQKRNFSTTN